MLFIYNYDREKDVTSSVEYPLGKRMKRICFICCKISRSASYTSHLVYKLIVNVNFFSDKSRRATLLQELREELKNTEMIFNKDQLQLSSTIGQGNIDGKIHNNNICSVLLCEDCPLSNS